MQNKNSNERYSRRGVSASKEDVHNAIRKMDKGLFPNAFCKVVPDFLTNNNTLFCLDCALCNIVLYLPVYL